LPDIQILVEVFFLILKTMFTTEEIEQFHRDGNIVVRGVFKGRELEALQEASKKVMEEGIAGEDEYHMYKDKPDGSKTYFRSELMWDRDPIFKAAAVHPELLTCYGQLLGHFFIPIVDSFVCKIPRGDVPIPWHQDPPYGVKKPGSVSVERKETYGMPNIDADIYLDRSTIENGCLWVIPEHHLVGHVEVESYSEDELFNKLGAIPIELEPGDVNFHCISAPHGSLGNKTDDLRRTFYIHYMNEEIYNLYAGIDSPSYRRLKSRGLFTENGIAFVHQMVDARKELGLGDLDDSDIEMTNEGFEFIGEPKTPPRYWEKLIGEMSKEEMEQKRKLQSVVV
jgi:ectoine hydroxylase-related dioxygenase (phytanoyl-CoA dioxygenase family)